MTKPTLSDPFAELRKILTEKIQEAEGHRRGGKPGSGYVDWQTGRIEAWREVLAMLPKQPLLVDGLLGSFLPNSVLPPGVDLFLALEVGQEDPVEHSFDLDADPAPQLVPMPGDQV